MAERLEMTDKPCPVCKRVGDVSLMRGPSDELWHECDWCLWDSRIIADVVHQPAQPMAVRELLGGGYVVASETRRGVWYLVDQGAGADPSLPGCSCPSTLTMCKHLRRVAELCRAKDDRLNAARPKMAAAPGGVFVD